MTSTKILKVVPMNHAEKCPVCNGFGTVSKNKKECHSCGGDGYVIVPNFTSEYEAIHWDSFRPVMEENEN